MHVQAFISETAVKRFYIRVISWLSRSGENQCNIIFIGPQIQNLRDEFAAIIYLYALRRAVQRLQVLHYGDHIIALDRKISKDCQALPTKIINYSLGPDPTTIEQLIGDKIH